MPRTALGVCRVGLLVAGLLAGAGRGAGAEPVPWRHDYAAARQEAAASGRPLVIDFSTAHCIWCKRLHATTFRDPAVALSLARDSVPVELDGERVPWLTGALGITGYPTVVMAAPDGRILDVLEGYLDAPRFQERLQRVVAQVRGIDPLARVYREATSALAAGDYPRAIGLLQRLTRDGGTQPVQVHGRRLLQSLERQAAEVLARGRQLAAAGDARQAELLLGQVLRTYPGTEAARQAGDMLARRN
jgi:thioredoxin-like negative regulator of GroEL